VIEIKMDDRFPPATYFHYSPSGIHSPHHSIRSPAPPERERYCLSIGFQSTSATVHMGFNSFVWSMLFNPSLDVSTDALLVKRWNF